VKFADYSRLAWGSLVELAFGASLGAAFCVLTADQARLDFMRESASDWLTVTGQVLFPAAIAIWITYVNLESTTFGGYLRYRNVSGAFHFSFVYPAFVFFGTTVMLIFVKGTQVFWIPNAAIFLLGYSAAVFLAMVLNVTTLMRLYGTFRMELELERGPSAAQNATRTRDDVVKGD